MTNTSPRIHLTLKEDERGSKKKKNRWRDFFFINMSSFRHCQLLYSYWTSKIHFVRNGKKKWTQFFRRYFNIVYSYQLKRNLNAGKCLTKKMRFAGIFPLKMVFYFSRTWAYQGKVGHSNNKKRMKKRRIRERLAKNVRSLPWKMELYIWNIWQNSRPFTWMIFYKAPLPPSIFIITNDGKDGILGDVLCFALPLSLDRSLFRDTLNESSQLDVEFVYELRMWTLNKSPINQHLFKQSLE